MDHAKSCKHVTTECSKLEIVSKTDRIKIYQIKTYNTE